MTCCGEDKQTRFQTALMGNFRRSLNKLSCVSNFFSPPYSRKVRGPVIFWLNLYSDLYGSNKGWPGTETMTSDRIFKLTSSRFPQSFYTEYCLSNKGYQITSRAVYHKFYDKPTSNALRIKVQPWWYVGAKAFLD